MGSATEDKIENVLYGARAQGRLVNLVVDGAGRDLSGEITDISNGVVTLGPSAGNASGYVGPRSTISTHVIFSSIQAVSVYMNDEERRQAKKDRDAERVREREQRRARRLAGADEDGFDDEDDDEDDFEDEV